MGQTSSDHVFSTLRKRRNNESNLHIIIKTGANNTKLFVCTPDIAMLNNDTLGRSEKLL